MNKLDHLDIDGHLLYLLLAVVDTGSVTRAAERLGVTQSAVSHMLDKLRAISNDPLFVKSGRGIVATEHALALALRARELLSAMESFAQAGRFTPDSWRGDITIAANDLQRDLLLPGLMARLRACAPHLRLRVIPSDVPRLDMLRNEHCQLIVSPRPPDGTDVVQKRLFSDHYLVYFDAACRSAPQSRTDYLAASHVTVVYEPRRALDLDLWLASQGIEREIQVSVPGFAGMAPFIVGTQLLATAPSLLQQHLLRGLASAPVPLPCPPLPMYMIWHLRHQHNPAHAWLRGELEALARELIPHASPAGTPPTTA